MQYLLDNDCDWIIIGEDDVMPQTHEAVTGYHNAAQNGPWSHLCFHAHGDHNTAPLYESTRGVTIWPSIVGTWWIYSAASLRDVGLMDEEMVNAFEHAEHTLRLATAGYAAPWPGCADATGSEHWLQEIPESLELTSIPFTGRAERMRHAREVWKKKRPDTYRLLWPHDL